PAAAFAKCAQSGLVDAVLIFDEQGRVSYPSLPSAVNSDFAELEPKWQKASRFEYLGKHLEAAKEYNALALAATNEHAAARAFQAEARCRLQAGQKEAVVQIANEILGGDRYPQAVDLQGRLIAANAELLALELIANRTSPLFQALAHRL